MAQINVKDAAGATVAIEKPLPPGRAAAAASRPIVLSTEDKAALDALLAKLIGAPATEAKQDAANVLLTTIAGYLDGVEALLDAIAVRDSTGALINPDNFAQTLTYNADGTVATVSFTNGTNTWTQTFTYTSGNLTGISRWVRS